MKRPIPETVVAGLASTSAKIRALAQADYDRAEIAKLLGIRYQHVRNVLVGAGITGGLQRTVQAEREPVSVPAAHPPREVTAPSILLEAGFHRVGSWVLGDGGGIVIDGKAPAEAGVYAFVVDDAIMYVGMTNHGLRACFEQYRRGDRRQRTRSRVNGLIQQALLEGKTVEAMIALPKPLDWNGLPVNGAAGLEAGLIQMIRPPWNIQGAT